MKLYSACIVFKAVTLCCKTVLFCRLKNVSVYAAVCQFGITMVTAEGSTDTFGRAAAKVEAVSSCFGKFVLLNLIQSLIL